MWEPAQSNGEGRKHDWHPKYKLNIINNLTEYTNSRQGALGHVCDRGCHAILTIVISGDSVDGPVKMRNVGSSRVAARSVRLALGRWPPRYRGGNSIRRLLQYLSCVLLAASCADSSERPTPADDAPIVVDAITLRREFQENEIRAEQKYSGRTIVVGGIVDRIGQDILGDGFITFRGEALFNVQAMFEDKTDLIEISPGQKLVVWCQEVDGGDMLGVLLSGCTAPAGLQVAE